MSSVALTFSAPSSLVLCAFLFAFSAHWCRLSERRTSRRSPTAEKNPSDPAESVELGVRSQAVDVAEVEHLLGRLNSAPFPKSTLAPVLNAREHCCSLPFIFIFLINFIFSELRGSVCLLPHRFLINVFEVRKSKR